MLGDFGQAFQTLWAIVVEATIVEYPSSVEIECYSKKNG